MNFEFTPEHDALREVVRDYADSTLRPRSQERDRDAVFPHDVWADLGKMGLAGIAVGEENGGSAGDYVSIGIVAEEMARGDHSSSYFMLVAPIVGELLDRWASPAVQQRWLPDFVAGQKLVGFGVTEGTGGSDAASIRMRAEATPEGYRLSGEKNGVTMAMALDAMVITARTFRDGVDHGISVFLVDMTLPGIARHPIDDMGARSIGRGIIGFDDVVIPEDHLIGGEGQGLRSVLAGFDCTRVILGLMAIGAAMRSLDETIEYVSERTAFGRPIATNQGVHFPIAEHHSRLDMARLYCYYALWLRDNGRPHTREAAVCKWLGPELSLSAVHDCIILHGHFGWTRDLPFEQRVRDIIGTEIADGTPQIAKSVIARDLFGRDLIRLDGSWSQPSRDERH